MLGRRKAPPVAPEPLEQPNLLLGNAGLLGCLLLVLFTGARIRGSSTRDRMCNKALALTCTVWGNFDMTSGCLAQHALANVILASVVLVLGELIAAPGQWLEKGRAANDEEDNQSKVAEAQARLAAMEANAIELARKNQEDQAQIAADKRLNHVIKGRCGSAISAVQTFRQLLGPFLRCELTDEMEILLCSPVAHLQEAIEWCHRRQVFVQLEEKTYSSRQTPVDLRAVLEDILTGSGSLYTNVSQVVAVDETVLKICLDEIISNALKYRKKLSPLRINARFDSGFLYVEVQNYNPENAVLLTDEERELVMMPGFKAHTCSAMSDGVGLDAVRKAVTAASGSVVLEQDAMMTTVRFTLPATLLEHRLPASLEVSRAVSSSPVVKVDLKYDAQAIGDNAADRERAKHASAGEAMQNPLVAKPTNKSGTRSTSPVGPGTGASGNKRASICPSDDAPRDRSCSPSTRRAAKDSGSALETAQPLKCVGFTNSDHESIFLLKLFADQLNASASAVLDATPSVCRGFIDVVLDHSKNGGCSPADVVVLYGLASTVDSERDTQVSPIEFAEQLRGAGFTGTVILFSESPSQWEVEKLRAQKSIDLFMRRGSLVEDVGRAVRAILPMPLEEPSIGDLRLEYSEPIEQKMVIPAAAAISYSHGTFASPQAVEKTMVEETATERNGSRKRDSSLDPSVDDTLAESSSAPSSVIDWVVDGPSCIVNSKAQSEAQHYSLTTPAHGERKDAIDETPEAEATNPKRGFRVFGLDDERIPRMIQGMFMKHHLRADMEVSCSLGSTEEEILKFVDVALGILNPDLTATHGPRVQADVVLMDENIQPPKILGSILADELRQRGFSGRIVLLTGASATYASELRSRPSVDLVFEKGTPLARMAEEIRALIDDNEGAALHNDDQRSDH